MEAKNLNTLLKDISYEFFDENRYTITDFTHSGLEYSAICNNGYTKLHTTRGKAYWLAQNELGHLTPDWKFHVSVCHKDAQKAWNLITKIFLENECRSGMKVLYLKENTNTAKGREITIYIFKYVRDYAESSIAVEFKLSYTDEHSEDYWVNIVDQIEQAMIDNKITSNGLAKGDLALGKYVSLRNEAFTWDKKTQLHIYPPDECGWNAVMHSLPFNLNKFTQYRERSRGLLGYSVCSILILLSSYIAFKYYTLS